MKVCRRVGAGVTCSTDWWAFSGSRCTVVWQAKRIPMVSPGQRRSVLSDCELVKASKSGVSGLGRSSSKCGPGRAPRCRLELGQASRTCRAMAGVSTHDYSSLGQHEILVGCHRAFVSNAVRFSMGYALIESVNHTEPRSRHTHSAHPDILHFRLLPRCRISTPSCLSRSRACRSTA